MAEEDVIKIRLERPLGEFPDYDKKKEYIKGLLQSTNPLYVGGAGQTYKMASDKIKEAVDLIWEHSPKLIEIWKGPDSEQARVALEKLYTTGDELKTKLSKMSEVLEAYAGKVEQALVKIDEEVHVPAGVSADGTDPDWVKAQLEDAHARQTLYDLNQQIVTIYDDVPDEIAYDLPTVNLPSTPLDTQDPNYPTDPPPYDPGPYTPVNDSGGSYGTGGSAAGSTNTGGTDGESDSGGSNPGGSNPGGSNPGGSNPGGSDPGDSTTPDPSTPDDPAPTPDPPTTPEPDQPQDPGTTDPSDNPVPPVIGNDDRTTTDGTNGTDPRQTDMASYQPPTSLITPSATTPAPTITPASYTVPGPMGGSPGIPSVIGSPGVGGGQSSLAVAGGRTAGGTPGGMPFMPFMGGAGGDGHGDLERNTYLSEDASCWTTGHETTDPVIG
ncbi:hypothetical protein ACQEVF_11435 [Nonomuraea polychroma]|uniref:hypothetical protein n=1 Tax=Nonomuraea polychroma TaxID=46176 RepID=UPI003D8C4EBA